MEHQLKELLKRKVADEMSRMENNSSFVELQSSYGEIGKSDANLTGMNFQENEYRPVSALLSGPLRTNLIQFALPINKAVR